MAQLAFEPENATRENEDRTVFAQRIDTPVGPMLAIADDQAVLACEFIDGSMVDPIYDRLQRRRSGVEIVEAGNALTERVRQQLTEYFDRKRGIFDLPLDPGGTEFECRAWEKLNSIPFGETRTYGYQAAALGDANACRAVGRANGRNPIPIIIPCHRVIGASGSLTGYGGGIDRKKWLLEFERDAGLFARR